MNHEQSDGVEAQPQPTLCTNGCGFFANAGTSGMCSKCYRQTEQAQQTLAGAIDAVAAAASTKATAAASEAQEASQHNEQGAAATPSLPCVPPLVSPVVPTATSSAEAPPPPPPCRCLAAGCRKRLGLTGFTCRCGLTFCATHRLAESHSCTFDYKTFERLKIADHNPLVKASKVQKL